METFHEQATRLTERKNLIGFALSMLLSLIVDRSTFAAEAEAAPKHRPTVALALGGGGCRGVAHVGVLRVLEREGIPIDYIAGTSMGAIVGGLYCAGVSVNEIQDRLLNKSLLHAFQTVPIPVRVAAIPIFFVPHMFGYHPYDGLYEGNRFAHYLNNCVPEANHDIEEMRIPFCAVASNLMDGKACTVSKGNLGRALQASSAIPMLRKPVAMGDDKLLIDGGLEANLPCKQAKAMGADIVIGINVDETFDGVTEKTFRKIMSVPHRAISMILAKVDEEQVKAADIVVHPDVNGIYLLSNSRKDAARAIKAGEQAAEAALPAIRARLNNFTIAESEATH